MGLKNKLMKQAFAYYRVSTEEQAQEGKSIETQQKLCRKWAADNEYRIIAEFIDEGKSATSLNRPALKDMLAKCQERDIDVTAILLQDTDRLARNTSDHFAIRAILKKADIQLISISQPMINDSPEGAFVDGIIACVNAFQSQITGRKTSKVLEQKALMGWYPGGQPMLGYHNVVNPHPIGTLDKQIIDLDKDVSPYVKQGFEMYATGSYNVQQIADFLISKNIPSPKGCKIHRSYVARMLRSEFYLGVFIWNKKKYDNARHPKLISPELYMKVQQVLNTHNQNATRKRKHNMLLRGFIFCGNCERQMWGEKHVKASGKVCEDYFCPSCRKSTYVGKDKLEERVERIFKKIELSKGYVEHVLETAKRILEEDRSNQHNDKVRLYHEKTKIEKAMREAEDARFIEKSLTKERFEEIYTRYETRLNNVNVDITNVDKDRSYSISVLEKVLKLSENIGSAYDEAPYLLKRKYLGIFFKKLIVKNGKITRFYLSDELKPLIENGSARVTSIGLRD